MLVFALFAFSCSHARSPMSETIPITSKKLDSNYDGNRIGDDDDDGVTNDKDLCPSIQEDKDGYEDEDGCPDIDNDGDGKLDKDDMCPNEPEMNNGFQDEDGCPDKTFLPVRKWDCTSRIHQIVYFDRNSSRIKKNSYPVLDAVVVTINSVSMILEVMVVGFISKDEEGMRDLSVSRADAVKTYLLERLQERTKQNNEGKSSLMIVTVSGGIGRDYRNFKNEIGQNRRAEFRITKQIGCEK